MMQRGLLAQGASLTVPILALAIGAAAMLLPADHVGLISPAQAQVDADGRKKEQERQKKSGPSVQQHAPSYKPPSPGGPSHGTPSHKAPTYKSQTYQAPKYEGAPLQKPLTPSKPLSSGKELAKPPQPFDRPGIKSGEPLQRKPGPELKPELKPAHRPDLKPDLKKESIKRPTTPPDSGQHGGPLKPGIKLPPSIAKPPSGETVKVAPPGTPKVAPLPSGAVLKRFDDVKRFRVERVEAGGKRKVIEEPGKRLIIKEGGRSIVRHDETERFLKRPGAKLDRRPDGSSETVYVRPDGTRIVTVVDAHGRLLRRYRIGRDGREHRLIDNRRFYRGLAIGVGVGALGIIALQLPPLQVTIPADKYVVPYDDASDDDLYEALDAPPIEILDRAYSLAEIRDNHELLARLRSIDIDTIHFESGAWEVSPDQSDKLGRIARAMLRVLERNPDAVFMIVGHTDAVGTSEDNLSLSDRRALAVAEVLTERFDVPAENLVTQGYGEQFLKVDTEEPEPRNRRVSILNITALMAER
jgi:outer membrane protein OmpA-like peptidoglycan-associated protein